MRIAGLDGRKTLPPAIAGNPCVTKKSMAYGHRLASSELNATSYATRSCLWSTSDRLPSIAACAAVGAHSF